VLWRASKYLLAVPAVIVLLTLAVINRHGVMLPFYAYLIGMLLIGILIGGLAVWVTQGRWRRSARRRGAEAQRWRAEADRLARERHAGLATDR